MQKILLPQQTYFVTTNVRNREWIFVDRSTNKPRDTYCNVLMNNLGFYRKKYSFLFHGFVIMPDHTHILLTLGPQGTIIDVFRDWKHRTGYEMNRLLNRRGPFWQRDFWAHAVGHDWEFETKLQYLHDNPVRLGLVGDSLEWAYSSARWYEGVPSIFPVDSFL